MRGLKPVGVCILVFGMSLAVHIRPSIICIGRNTCISSHTHMEIGGMMLIGCQVVEIHATGSLIYLLHSPVAANDVSIIQSYQFRNSHHQ